VRFIAGSGFNAVSMTTNGFLINKSMASAIADSGLSMISMSLESLDEAVHDSIRGIKGACRKVMEAFEYFKDYPGGLKKLGIQTIVMGPNLEGILDLVQWAHTRNISIYFMAIAQPLCLSLSSDWYLESEYDFLWPKKKEKLFKVIESLIRFKENGVDIGNTVAQLKAFKTYFSDPNKFVKKHRQCKMGDGMLKVDPQGNVSLCAEKGSIGNVRTDRIKDLWLSEKAANVRESIKTCKTNCPQLINCFFEE
jgi:MoaA/NifB/PqqE/SkfB family radical SAM enzyme